MAISHFSPLVKVYWITSTTAPLTSHLFNRSPIRLVSPSFTLLGTSQSKFPLTFSISNLSQLGSTFSPDTGAFQDAAQYEPTTGHDEPFQDTNSFAPRHGSPPPQADDANYSLPQTEEDTCPQGEDGDEDTASPSGTSNMARARTSTSGVTPLSDQVIKSAGPRGQATIPISL